jgi:primosomal protein N' (replication factor Y)
MIPAVLKGSYAKTVIVKDEKRMKKEFPSLSAHFFGKTNPSYDEIIKYADAPSALQKGYLEVQYEVNDKSHIKKVTWVKRTLSINKLTEAKKQLSGRAQKQHEVLDLFIKQSEKDMLPLSEVLEKTGASRQAVKALEEKSLLSLEAVEQYRDPYENSNIGKTEPLTLTDNQAKVLSPINEAIRLGKHQVTLCHGVTGSGKTEIYLQAIETVLSEGKEAIVLVPEIALTPQMVYRFKGRFGARVAVMHSGLSRGEKYDEWRKIQKGEVDVVVGARSAVFVPFKKIGLIIIDEEHETSYKQEENPRYHARDVAIFRGEHHRCPVLLGSATPSLESYARGEKGVYELSELPDRVNKQDMPHVHMVDMREELRAGNRSIFSKQLFELLTDRLNKRQQSVLFLNRRGYSTFVMCRDCGYVIQCPHCDISLTFHQRSAKLKCHYCGHEEHMPSVCPSCESDHIRYFGSGTQKVEETLTQLLPEAKVLRMDVDTTQKKGSHERLLNAFGEGKADILLGTQMIAKGLDFPNVTLVGVIAADSMLHLPDFRASEKTFQLLTQVSGRAGRHHLKGEVVVQSYTPEHYAVQRASEHDYHGFYQLEMRERKAHQYPPFFYLSLVTVSHPQFPEAVDITEKIAAFLKKKLSKGAVILGPVAAPIPRIKDRYRYQCMVKYKNEPDLLETLGAIQKHYQDKFSKDALQIAIDMNPYLLM